MPTEDPAVELTIKVCRLGVRRLDRVLPIATPVGQGWIPSSVPSSKLALSANDIECCSMPLPLRSGYVSWQKYAIVLARLVGLLCCPIKIKIEFNNIDSRLSQKAKLPAFCMPCNRLLDGGFIHVTSICNARCLERRGSRSDVRIQPGTRRGDEVDRNLAPGTVGLCRDRIGG